MTQNKDSDITKKCTCIICGKILSFRGLPAHIKHNHTDVVKNIREYYDKYLKQPDEGICLKCGKPTAFNNFLDGYNKYCSIKCANSSELRLEHIKETNLKKYGTESSLANKQVREKAKNTIQNKYGVDNVFKAESIKDKIKHTWLEKYGTDNPNKSNEVKDRMKQTCLNKYGVNYSFQSENNKEKSKQTCLKKYGTEYPQQSKVLRNNQLKKYCIENSVIPLNELDLYCQTKCCEHFNIPISYYKKHAFIPNTTDINSLIEYSNELQNNKGTIIEKELDDYLTLLGIKHVMRDFSTISPQQLDYYIPEYKVAIEIDGIYWHSTNYGKSKNYHLNKTVQCEELGIRLIHFTDFEWNTKTNICKSILCSALNIYEQKIYARSCKIKEVDTQQAKQFLDNNHIQGSVNSTYKLGLFYNNELVQLITIGKSRFKKNEYELLRMCTKLNTQVIGGFSKLMKHQPYKNIISYVDRSKYTGKSYLTNDLFSFVKFTKPNYKYYNGKCCISRISAQKHKLQKLLGDKFDKNLSEANNMINAGWLQVYDCGNIKVRYNNCE